MRITRLQLLLILMGLAALGYSILIARMNRLDEEGIFALRSAQSTQEFQTARAASAVEARRQENAAMERLRKNVVASVAVIGEAYQPLRQQFGEIPAIAEPLRQAKELLAKEQYDEAMPYAHTAWTAVKEFRLKVAALPAGHYAVRRGDTLWQIAARHSPVHRGAGWVAIWKANRSRINDFDRLETGMSLKIPQKRARYEMPFWKPPAQ